MKCKLLPRYLKIVYQEYLHLRDEKLDSIALWGLQFTLSKKRMWHSLLLKIMTTLDYTNMNINEVLYTSAISSLPRIRLTLNRGHYNLNRWGEKVRDEHDILYSVS